MKVYVFTMVLLGISSSANSNTLYKCTDSSGVVSYENKRQGPDRSCVVLSYQPPPDSPKPKQLSKDAKENQQKFAVELEKARGEALAASRNNSFVCNGEAHCKKAFQLTQVFISNNADMKLQTTTDTIIETYNPIELGKVGLKAAKVPSKGSTESISLVVSCKGQEDGSKSALVCAKRMTRIYQAFRPFIETSLR